MYEKNQLKRKYQAQLDELKTDISKLKAQASVTKAEAQTEMNKQVEALEHILENAQSKLSEFAGASEDAIDSLRQGVESAWNTLKTAVNDTKSKFRN